MAAIRTSPGGHTSPLSGFAPVRAYSHGGVKRDVDYLGDGLSVDLVRFEKGVLIHPEAGKGDPYADVVYDLTDLPARQVFTAYVGVEDDAGSRGSVTFAVEVELQGEWQRVYLSPKRTHADNMEVIRIPFAGATKLRLYCTDAGNGINSDHAAWGMARLE